MIEPLSPVNASSGRPLSKKEVIACLEEPDPDQVAELYREGDRVRKEFMGDEVNSRGIIEFSKSASALSFLTRILSWRQPRREGSIKRSGSSP